MKNRHVVGNKDRKKYFFMIKDAFPDIDIPSKSKMEIAKIIKYVGKLHKELKSVQIYVRKNNDTYYYHNYSMIITSPKQLFLEEECLPLSEKDLNSLKDLIERCKKDEGDKIGNFCRIEEKYKSRKTTVIRTKKDKLLFYAPTVFDILKKYPESKIVSLGEKGYLLHLALDPVNLYIMNREESDLLENFFRG